MDYIGLVEETRKELLKKVNQECDNLIRIYQGGEQGIRPEDAIRECRLGWASPSMLKGKRPVSLTFVSGETVETPTWKKAVQAILKKCNEQPDTHEKLMRLRGNVFGRQRIILGESPEEMDVPLRVDEGLYFESKFDTEALIKMMKEKVLEPAGYDFSGIVIRYTPKKQAASEKPAVTRGETWEDMPEETQSGGMELG